MNNINFHYDQGLGLQMVERLELRDFLKMETFQIRKVQKKRSVTVSPPLGNFVPKFIQEEDLEEKHF